jgi:hypothetical protein
MSQINSQNGGEVCKTVGLALIRCANASRITSFNEWNRKDVSLMLTFDFGPFTVAYSPSSRLVYSYLQVTGGEYRNFTNGKIKHGSRQIPKRQRCQSRF